MESPGLNRYLKILITTAIITALSGVGPVLAASLSPGHDCNGLCCGPSPYRPSRQNHPEGLGRVLLEAWGCCCGNADQACRLDSFPPDRPALYPAPNKERPKYQAAILTGGPRGGSGNQTTCLPPAGPGPPDNLSGLYLKNMIFLN